MTKTRDEWRSLIAACAAGLLIWGTAINAGTQTGRPGTPALIIDSLAGHDTYDRDLATLQAAAPSVDTGRDLFLTHCASCHGASARGNGPMADRLRNQPPDLTTFTARNGGTFPSARVHDIIEGRTVASHGTREMPVWGNGFSNSRNGYRPDEIKRRIDALVKYLESIQTRGA